MQYVVVSNVPFFFFFSNLLSHFLELHIFCFLFGKLTILWLLLKTFVVTSKRVSLLLFLCHLT